MGFSPFAEGGLFEGSVWGCGGGDGSLWVRRGRGGVGCSRLSVLTAWY